MNIARLLTFLILPLAFITNCSEQPRTSSYRTRTPTNPGSNTNGNPDSGATVNNSFDAGGSNPSANTDAGAMTPVQSDNFVSTNLAAEFVDAYCQVLERCEPFAEGFLKNESWRKPCRQRLNDKYVGIFDAYARVIAADRLRFDRARFDEFIQKSKTHDCLLGLDPWPTQDFWTTQLFDRGNVNDSWLQYFFVGRQTVGTSCSLKIECDQNSYCSVQSENGSCGTCLARANNGEDCSNRICGKGLTCAGANGSESCYPGTLEIGQSCGTAGTGFCRGQLQCAGESGSRICNRPLEAGASCALAPFFSKVVERPSCNGFANRVCYGRSVDDYSCRSWDWNFCPICSVYSAECNAAGDLCEYAPRAGQPCDSRGQCDKGAYCKDNFVCKPRESFGAACSHSRECSEEANLYCINNKCSTYTYTMCP